MDLADIRQAIDGIDTTLLNSFVERMDIATEVAKSKIEMGKAIFDPARERSKLNNLAGRAPERYEAQTIALFRLLMSMSKAEQQRYINELRGITVSQKAHATATAFDTPFPQTASVACQGVEGAYSQIAALEQRAKDAAARRTALEESLAALAARSEACRTEIAAIRKAKTDSQTTITQKEQAIREATEKRLACQQKETEALAKARTASDSREEVGREMARLAERKAAAETEYDQTVAKLWDEYQLSVSQAEQLCVEFDSLTALRAQVADLRGKIRALGSVNVSAIEEYKEVKARYDELSRQVTDVEESRNELSRMIAKLSAQMREIFTDSFRAINENFSRVFTELFGGGEASLVLEDESDVLACGIGIRVAPPGKVIKNLEALSGGEQALVAISIYFAILAVNPAPFCILDEIEAALDDANVVRFAQYLRRISDKTQFIVITHRRGTMEAANVLYGVTMQEDGVSKLLKLDLEQVDATLVS